MDTYPSSIVYHVDDSPVDQLIIKKMFQREAPHVEVRQFCSVPKIMNALMSGEGPLPHLLIVNLYLPQTMGWELIEAMETTQVGSVKIVVVTSSIVPDDQHRARQYTVVSDFKTKPLSQQDVHDVLSYLP